MTKLLEGRIALVTGASRGIGAAVAKRFAAEGAHVIITARTVSGLEETDDAIKELGGEATIVPLDLLEYNKIDELGSIIAGRFGKLDILVGNAAMLGLLSPVAHIEPKIWDKTIALNLTANFRLIRSFDPLLRTSSAGRAMFVTSGITKREAPYWGAYAASKIALENLVEIYASETKNTNVKVNLIDPGVVRTSMRAEAMPGEDPLILPPPEEITDVFVELAQDSFNESGVLVHAGYIAKMREKLQSSN
jgi:NAD(P)-dependent dehydrogenase (short-subunit alcohol dehydrogenase family)